MRVEVGVVVVVVAAAAVVAALVVVVVGDERRRRLCLFRKLGFMVCCVGGIAPKDVTGSIIVLMCVSNVE